MHGQLVVEREFLGHVTDQRLDALRFTGDVVAGNRCATLARLQEAAEHPDDRGFAGTIRAKETEDGTLADGETDVIDRSKVAELFSQVFTRDHDGASANDVRNAHRSDTVESPLKAQPIRPF